MVNLLISISTRLRNLFLDDRFKEISQGSVLTLAARIGGVLLGLLFSLIITRQYGAEIMGVVAMINSLMMITIMIGTMGFNTSVLKIIPGQIAVYSHSSAFANFKRIVGLVFLVSLFVGIIMYVSSDFISSSILHNPGLKPLIKLLAIFIFINSIGHVSIETLRALKSVKLFSLMQMARGFSNIVLVTFCTLLFYDRYIPVYVIFITMLLVAFVAFVLVILIFKKNNNAETEVKIHTESYDKLIRLSFPMLLTASMNILLSQIDILMLGGFRTEKEVGIYTITMKLALLASFVLTAINSISAPKFSELYHNGKIEELSYIAKKSSKLTFWLTVPILAILVIFGEYLLNFFGPDFNMGYIALLLLVAGQFINSATGSVGYYLNMTGYQNTYKNILILSILINVVLNYSLIPTYGIYGAAFASMISIGFSNVTAAIYVRKKFGFSISYIPFLTKD